MRQPGVQERHAHARKPIHGGVVVTTNASTEPSSLTTLPAWRALDGARRADARRAPALAVRQRPLARRAPRRRSRRPVPRLLEEPHHRRDASSPRGSGRGVRTARTHRRDVPRREDQHDGGSRGAPRRASRAARRVDRPRRRQRRAARARGARSDGGVRRPGPGRPLARAHGPARAHRHQYRDRRLRSRSGHGLRGAEALQRAGPELPLRLERGRHRLRRGDARSRSRRNAVHRLVEDVHHARDDDERADGAPVGARRARRRASHRPALRRGLDQRRTGGGIRHRHRATCSDSGTGSAAGTRWTRRSGCRP